MSPPPARASVIAPEDRDWSQLELDFVQGSETLADFAARLDISYGTVRKQAATRGWSQKREEYRNRIGTLAEQKAVDQSASTLVAKWDACNTKDLDIATQLREKALSLLPACAEPKDLRALALTFQTAQTMARTALGMESAAPSVAADSHARWAATPGEAGLPPEASDRLRQLEQAESGHA